MRCIHKQGTSYFRNEVIKQFQNEPSPRSELCHLHAFEYAACL